MTSTTSNDSSPDATTVVRLVAAARAAATFAYVPYSRFPVGAAVLTESDEIVTGANIENASFGLTCCAERVAIFKAAAAGHRTIRAVAVSAPRAPGTTPCGACRQVINEFKSVDEATVVILDDGAEHSIVPFEALLPRAFGPRDLERAARDA